MSLETQFVWNETNYNAYFHSWAGPVGRNIAARAAFVEAGAVASCGFRTGRLKSAIGTHFTYHGTELEARVGANPAGDRVGYAYFHHEGTRPHRIRAGTGEVMRFVTQAGPRFATTVNHPGTKPNPYLTRWLREAVL